MKCQTTIITLMLCLVAIANCGGHRSERLEENINKTPDMHSKVRTWDDGNVTVTLENDGILKLSGDGPMRDSERITPWYDVKDSIVKVIIEEGVTSIGRNAFRSCTNLVSVSIPSSVTTIGTSAFSDCHNLTSVTVSVNNVNYSSEDGVLFDKSQTTLILYPQGRQGAYMIPNTVAEINFWAFFGSTGLTSVKISKSVMAIETSVFNECINLVSIDVDNANPRYRAINGVLFNKTKDTLVMYPRGRYGTYTIPNNVSAIAEDAFTDCYGLIAVTIPTSVSSIGGGAFAHCTSLTSIIIPNSVTYIGDGAFDYCTGLMSVVISNSIAEVGAATFRGCTNVKSVMIPNGVTKIREGAFFESTNLASIIIPSSVKIIENWVFYACTSLTYIAIWNTAPPGIARKTFGGIPSNACLYVPENSINAYRTANGWDKFECIKAVP